MTEIELFREIYSREPQSSFCPYRICPLGAHIDHQLGMVHGMALDRGIHIAYGIKQNGIIEVRSMNFPKRVQFHVLSVPETKEGDWGDYLRGAAIELGRIHKLKYGMSAVVRGTLPSGGISSSAALTISFLQALCSVNDIQLTAAEYIRLAKSAENNYVGVSTGKLDQSCETLCQKDSLLALDCMDDSYKNYRAPANMPPFSIGIFFSGLERNLAQSSAYNNRVDECRGAAFALYCTENPGIKEGLRFNDMSLRLIPESLFDKYKDKLPESWQKRATHYFSEMARVKEGIKYWQDGDLVSYGRLINESGLSSINNYECGSDELITLYRILSSAEGVYGARFSGAGFKGCCMALINPENEKSILKLVESEYLKKFPNMKDKYKAYICTTSDGILNQ